MRDPANKLIKCPACESMNVKFKWRWFDDMSLSWTDSVLIYLCRSCGLLFSLLTGTANEMYDSKYYIFNDHRESADRAFAENCLAWLNERCPVAGKSLLDIGCGKGYFCETAKKYGAYVTGLEPSSQVAQEVRERTGISVFAVFLEEFNDAPTGYDVLTMWDVLEHSPTPIRMLTKAYALLRPNGMLAITVPNFSSIFSLVAGPFWKGFNPYHVSHFSINTCREVLKKAGFSIIAVETSDNCVLSREGLFRLGLKDHCKALCAGIPLIRNTLIKRRAAINDHCPYTGHNDYMHMRRCPVISRLVERMVQRLRLGDQLRVLAAKQ